eukprot:CAMPEP_0182463652 /NCGR_PEP_ID=MMETSP1319-20130603/7816_1 /TAXON_ID=172717 /ORGANISM="Bolidomonas pacifica, Strain RCC208" /LENGTH=91 /DNA_ID=CAMNT_0024663223 /DNA_START=275 /DNA_END=548 /DNA_ORIENTATION=-
MTAKFCTFADMDDSTSSWIMQSGSEAVPKRITTTRWSVWTMAWSTAHAEVGGGGGMPSPRKSGGGAPKSTSQVAEGCIRRAARKLRIEKGL